MSFQIWENVYFDFVTANKHKEGLGFSGKKYLERSLLAATESMKALKTKKEIPFFHKQRNIDLIIIVSMMLSRRTKKLRILDFGGGFGIAYMNLIENIPNVVNHIEYTVVDNFEVCKQAKILFDRESSITFLESLPKKDVFDLVYSSSCVQYIENWKEVLRELSTFNADHIYFSDFFCSLSKSFVTLQNYYESKIPHWFFNLDEFKRELEKNKYGLNFRIPTNLERLGQKNLMSLANFPPGLITSQTYNLLFSKNDII
jgi:putative methyltransferase (TIGR04325 family)